MKTRENVFMKFKEKSAGLWFKTGKKISFQPWYFPGVWSSADEGRSLWILQLQRLVLTCSRKGCHGHISWKQKLRTNLKAQHTENKQILIQGLALQCDQRKEVLFFTYFSEAASKDYKRYFGAKIWDFQGFLKNKKNNNLFLHLHTKLLDPCVVKVPTGRKNSPDAVLVSALHSLLFATSARSLLWTHKASVQLSAYILPLSAFCGSTKGRQFSFSTFVQNFDAIQLPRSSAAAFSLC